MSDSNGNVRLPRWVAIIGVSAFSTGMVAWAGYIHRAVTTTEQNVVTLRAVAADAKDVSTEIAAIKTSHEAVIERLRRIESKLDRLSP